MLRIVYPICCGMDVHKSFLVACIATTNNQGVTTYISANILVATKKDFEPKNRKRFCGRIATGDYDAIIIGHSQFEKIPMSAARQRALLEQQMDEIMAGIAELKENHGERFSIRQIKDSDVFQLITTV